MDSTALNTCEDCGDRYVWEHYCGDDSCPVCHADWKASHADDCERA